MPMNSALRQKWTSAGYGSVMGSAEVAPPPGRDYMRVYHLTSAEHAISNISLARLKVARFSDLNDPFELMALNLRERRVRNIVSGFKDEYNKHTGVLCFSSDWTNPVLWSHYGDKHRGICLGFNVKKNRLEKVQYEDRRIRRELGEQGNPLNLDDQLQDLLLRTKFRHWQYESELRRFVKLSDTITEARMHFCPFDKDLTLAEVILGHRCNLSLEAVRRLVQAMQPDAVTLKARLAFKFFKVVPNEATVPSWVSRGRLKPLILARGTKSKKGGQAPLER